MKVYGKKRSTKDNGSRNQKALGKPKNAKAVKALLAKKAGSIKIKKNKKKEVGITCQDLMEQVLEEEDQEQEEEKEHAHKMQKRQATL